MDGWINRRTVKHPDWLKCASPRVIEAFRKQSIYPERLLVFMLVTPMRHALRSIYGSDVRAALALLYLALRGIANRRWVDIRWWLYDIGLWKSEELSRIDRELREEGLR